MLMPSTRLSGVRWGSGMALAVWVELKWQVFNGLQTGSSHTPRLHLETRILNSRPAPTFNYPWLHRWENSVFTVESCWCQPTKFSKQRLIFSSSLPKLWSLHSQSCQGATLSGHHPRECKIHILLCFQGVTWQNRLPESYSSPKRSDKVRQNITCSSICPHSM